MNDMLSSPTISISSVAIVRERGGVIYQSVGSKYISEAAKGCADLLERLGILSPHCEGIKVIFGKETEESRRMKIIFRASFNVAEERFDVDTMLETTNPDALAQLVVDELGFKIGLKFRDLQDRFARGVELLNQRAPLALKFKEPTARQ